MRIRDSLLKRILLSILIFGFISESSASVELPKTPAALKLEEFINVYNSGDEQKWVDFILNNEKTANDKQLYLKCINRFYRSFSRYGILEIKRISESEDYKITVFSKAVEPPGPFEWAKITFSVDSLSTHMWTDFEIIADDPDEVHPEGDLTADKLKNFVDPIIDNLVLNDFFSGAILIAKDGKSLYKRAEGKSSKRYNVSNKVDTKFNLGSMNKMFTGVAIIKLVQDGKLSFDDLVGKHLPDYNNKEVREKVNIHHLLTHTAGTGLYWMEFFENSNWMNIKTVEDYDKLTTEKPLLFEPSEKYQYSNCGPIILGLIIEKVSGMSYDNFIREYITGPAGMKNTDCYDISEPIENLATGYTKMDILGNSLDNWINNTYMLPVKGGPAGGGYSTVEDLLLFDIALRNNKIVDEKYFNIMTTGKIENSHYSKYAYLFEEFIIDGKRIVGHSGGSPGASSVLRMFIDSGYTLAIMSNYDDGMSFLQHKLLNLLNKK